MAKPTVHRDRDAVIGAVALLRGEGRTLQEIGKILGMTDSCVSKIKRIATDRGWLRSVSTEEFHSGELSPSQMAAIREVAGSGLKANLQAALQRCCGHWFEIDLCDSGQEGTPRGLRLSSFGLGAAFHVQRLITLAHPAVSKVGVTYGRTLHAVLVRGFSELLPSNRHRPPEPVLVIPLRGSALLDHLPSSSSAVAYGLALALNGECLDQRLWRSLHAVPPVLPAQLRPGVALTVEEKETLGRYLTLVSDYVECFGPADGSTSTDSPLIDRLDIVFTSVGPRASLSPHTEELLCLGGLSSVDCLAGDMAGIPILAGSPHLSPQDKSALARFEESLLGMKRAHVESTIGRGGKVCVICAVDTERTECLYEVCHQRLATHLILDKQVARHLLEMCS